LKIAWTKPALHDLNEAAYYVRMDNPPAALRMLARIRASIHQLTMFPMLGRAGWKDGTRELVVPNTPYIVVYRVENKRVEILAVLHGARDWKGE
jgi:toxin ParE1/3/4